MKAPTASPATLKPQSPFARTRIAAAMRECLRLPPKALGIASLSLFGAEGGAWAQQSTAPVPHAARGARARHRFERVRDRLDERGDAHRHAAARHPAVHQHRPAVADPLAERDDAADALRNVPGIRYAAAEGGTQANQVFYLRGFPLNQDIFIDGVRDLGEYNRDLFATESVEVLKGPSALMFGRGRPAASSTRRARAPTAATRERGRADVRLVRPEARHRRRQLPHRRIQRLAPDRAGREFRQLPLSAGRREVRLRAELPVATSARDRRHAGSYYYLKASDVTDYGQPTLFSAALGFCGFPPMSPRNYYGFANYDYAHYETQHRDLRIDHQFSEDAVAQQHAALGQLQAAVGIDDPAALDATDRTAIRSPRRRRSTCCS